MSEPTTPEEQIPGLNPLSGDYHTARNVCAKMMCKDCYLRIPLIRSEETGKLYHRGRLCKAAILHNLSIAQLGGLDAI